MVLPNRPVAGVERPVWLGFAVVALGAALMVWPVYTNSTSLGRDQEAVEDSYETLGALEATLSSLQAVETGSRGFLLTGNASFLEPFNAGVARIDEDLARVKALSAGDPVQMARADALEALAAEKIQLANLSMAIKELQGDEAAVQFVAAGRGKAVMDDAGAVIAAMKRTESEQLHRLDDASRTSTRNSVVLLVAGTVSCLLLFVVLLAVLTRSLASTRRAKEANARLGAVVAASTDGIVSLNTDGHIDSWNAGAEHILGYSAPEVVGQHISRLVSPDQVEMQKSALEAVRQGGWVSGEEATLVSKDGRLLDISLSVFPLRDAGGMLTGIGGIFRDITARKRVERTLQESQQRFATIFDLSPAGICVIRTSDAIIIDTNRRLLEMFGFEREDIVGRTALELGTWADPSFRQMLVQRTRQAGSVRNMEMQWRTRSGKLLDTITSWQALELDGEGRAIGLIQDITEWKHAEREVDRLFEATPDFLCIAGLDGYFKRVNPTFERLLGYTEEESLATPFVDLVHPDDIAATQREMEKLAQGAETISFANRYRCKDGTYRWLSWNSVPVLEEGLIYAVARDVTAWREMEEALRRSEERFRSIVETANDAIIVIDQNGIIEAFSRSAESIFGHSADEVLGRNVSILVPPPHHEDHDRYVARHLATGERLLSPNRETTALRKNGEEFPIEITVSEVRVAGELRFTGVIRDISVRKQMEDELRQAKEAAENASLAKSNFLSRMSHELRTPLNVVLGFGQVLQLDALDPEQAEAVDYILRASRHLLNLIDEVLDIARIEAGRLLLSIEPVRADEILTEAMMLSRPLADQRGITLHAGFGTETAHVLADRQRVKQVLLNLVANAIKYNCEGGAVTIACDRREAALRFAIIDTGPGIPEEEIPHLFVSFERLGAEVTDVEGTGLGLALSKYLTEAMGGTIGVESSVGRGSTFWFELPVGEPPDGRPTAADLDGSADAAENERQAIEPGVRRLVLYIEDNLANLHLMERIFTRRLSVSLLAARQGGQGLELAREHRPDLILLDLHLPDMSGRDVLRELKANPSTREIPVVMVTADATAGQRDRLLNAGAYAYLTKPIEVKELLEVTDSILQTIS